MTTHDLVALVLASNDFAELKRELRRLLKKARQEDDETDRWANQQEDMNP